MTQTCFNADQLHAAAARFREPCFVIRDGTTGHVGVSFVVDSRFHCVASLPGLFPEWLGDRGFNDAHGTRFPYVAGSMAQGIATARMVVALSNAGLLGFFGAAGLSTTVISDAIDGIERGARGAWGANLIHNPDDPSAEDATARLFIERGVPNVSASAFMRLTPAVVRVAVKGLNDRASRWRFSYCRPSADHVVAICTERTPAAAERVRAVRTVPLGPDIACDPCVVRQSS